VLQVAEGLLANWKCGQIFMAEEFKTHNDRRHRCTRLSVGLQAQGDQTSRTFLPQLRFSFLHRCNNHITNTSIGTITIATKKRDSRLRKLMDTEPGDQHIAGIHCHRHRRARR